MASLMAVSLVCLGAGTAARELTLQEAFDIALAGTGRGMIIDGNLEVAEQNYFAEKINFYVPEISINGSLPAYRVNETYDFFPGTDVKGFGRSTRLDFDADITLKQNLITGGDLTVRANLVDNDWDYPLRTSSTVDGNTVFSSRTITEARKLGTFSFDLEQPILKPSDAKHQLRTSRDDMDLARLAGVEAAAELKSEVVQAFLGVLQAEINLSIGQAELESAQLKAEIDSMKLNDEIISEEDWLLSSSNRLDAELGKFDADNVMDQFQRDLMMLLEWEDEAPPRPLLPDTVIHLSESERQVTIDAWSDCVAIRKARLKYRKAEREADYAASAHGLTGTIAASYGMERGKIEDNRSGLSAGEDLQTDSWGISLNFRYPLWDGGASGAAVKAARLTAEQADLELQKAQKSARADIASLVNKVDLSHRKLGVLKRQIELAENRMNISQSRFDDGQISKLTFLESRISYLQARDKYLQEMKDYYLARVELEGKYLR
ncbi:MAG: TolC family protein [bacterium]